MGPGDPCADLEAIFVDPGGGEDTVNLSSVTAAAFPALDYVLVDTDEVGADEVDEVTGSPLPDQIDRRLLRHPRGRGRQRPDHRGRDGQRWPG